MPLPEEHQCQGVTPKNVRRLTLPALKKRVHEFYWNRNFSSKGGSTPDPCDDQWIFQEDPPNLTFLLASPNLGDEIHFKGGSL